MHLDTVPAWDVSMKGEAREARHKRGGGGLREGGRRDRGSRHFGREGGRTAFLPPSLPPPPPPLPFARLVTRLSAL